MDAPLSPAARWLHTLGYYSLFIAIGLSTGIAGPTIPDIAGQAGVGVGAMGLVFVCGSIGYTAGTFLGGRLFDRVRGHVLLGAAELVAAACLALLPAARWFGLVLALAVVRGVAEGVINTGANTLLVWTHGEKVSPFMNGLHFCFGVGTFLAPLAVGQLVSSGLSFRWAFWGVAVFDALAGLWLLTMPGSPDPRAHARRHEAGATRGGGGWLPVAVAALYLFFYVSGEISFGSWIYTYAVTLGIASAASAAYLTSAFWLAFTVGRLVSVPVAVRFAPRQVIPAALGACLVVTAAMLVFPQSSALVWTAAIALGFCMAPLWPTGFTLVGQLLPMTAFTTALVLLGDSLGGMVLPSLTGKVIEAAGAGRSLPLLVFASLVACAAAYAALLSWAARRRPTADAAGGA